MNSQRNTAGLSIRDTSRVKYNKILEEVGAVSICMECTISHQGHDALE